MPTESVTLNIRNQPANGNGWKNTIASNGDAYSYKYQGGHNNDGGMHVKVNEGAASLQLTVSCDDRYELAPTNAVTFRNDTGSQLSWAPANGLSGTINDLNTVAETAEYIVTVLDAQNGNCTIPCDPMISNEPKGPVIMHS